MVERKIIVVLLAVVGLLSLFSLPTTFAVGNVECPGAVIGSMSGGNVNVGTTYFDAHQLPVNNFSILGVAQGGYAPGNVGYAACTDFEKGTYHGVSYDHRIKGVAWNDNLGFISFNCEDGAYDSGVIGQGGAVSCGPYDYSTYVSVSGAGGERSLHGYAWNAALGYLQFDNPRFPQYDATVDAAGNVTGYAISSAGVWVKMDGMRIELATPQGVFLNNDEAFETGDGRVVLAGEDVAGGGGGDDAGVAGGRLGDWCDGRAYFCAEADPDPRGASLAVGVDNSVKVADGKDGYYLHLYFHGADGVAPLDTATVDFDSFTKRLKFVWEDTVKRNQTGGDNYDGRPKVGTNLNNVKRPWSEGDGAVRFKPMEWNDFEEVEPGHYRSKQMITSYAPTSDSNISYSTKTTPGFAFPNEQFLNPISGINPEREPNKLTLKWIEYPTLKDKDGNLLLGAGNILPEGNRSGLSFKFRPALEVSELYSGSREDAIEAYRGVPVNIHLKTAQYGDMDGKAVDDALVSVYLAYDQNATRREQNNCDVNNFNFNFLTDFSGEPVFGGTLFEQVDHLFNGDDVQAVANVPDQQFNDSQGAGVGGYGGYNSEADQLDGQPGNQSLPCQYAQAPSLYSMVNYLVDNRAVNYFSNKLPKTESKISNPSIVVHGNIYGQDLGNVSAQNRTQISGNLSVNVVRDTINVNLEKFDTATLQTKWKNRVECTVQRLSSEQRYRVAGSGCKKDVVYKHFRIGEEDVLYFRGAEVLMDLRPQDFNGGKWVIISDAGNVMINSDLNTHDSKDVRLTLVALRGKGDDYAETGHGYLKGGQATIVDATMIFDGSFFPYSGDLDFDDQGVPQWNSQQEKQDILGYQALLRGVVQSDNTIGGADLDGGEKGEKYLLAGGGEVLPINQANREKAQAFDLNYLRLFTLELELCADGSGQPVDQSCGKCWTVEDTIAQANGADVYGENGGLCNGIDPFDQFTGSANSLGDLVVPHDESRLVPEGLNNAPDRTEGDFDPVYVLFRAPDKDSFIFGN